MGDGLRCPPWEMASALGGFEKAYNGIDEPRVRSNKGPPGERPTIGFREHAELPGSGIP
jgi:hypothetical protein